MPNDRLVVTFPELGAVAMYDAVTGAQLNTFDKLELPEGLTMLDGDLLVAEGGSDRILDFPYLAKTTEQRFPGPHVLALVSGSSVAGVGCLFDTSALTVPRPPSFGLCNGASGGVAATAGTLDLFQSAPTPRPAPPAPRVVLDAAAANLVSGGQFRCSPVTPLGALSTIRCARFRQPDMHGVGGGALAALLLAAGRALGAAIIAGSQDNDFNFGGPVLVNVPRFRRSVGTASAAAVHRRVTVHLTPGKAAKVTFSLSPPARRALKRALRRHRVVHRTLVITVRDKTHGTSYKINRRLTFKRPRTG
jgi:hypothetical protein